MRASLCKSSICGQSMIWTRTEEGRSMPVDEEPSSDGGFRLEELRGEGPPLAIFVPPAERDRWKGQLHTSHFVTCVDAQHFREKGAKR